MGTPSPERVVLRPKSFCLAKDCDVSDQAYETLKRKTCTLCHRSEVECACAKARPYRSPAKPGKIHAPISKERIMEIWCNILFDRTFAQMKTKLTAQHYLCYKHFTPGSRCSPPIPTREVPKSFDEIRQLCRSYDVFSPDVFTLAEWDEENRRREDEKKIADGTLKVVNIDEVKDDVDSPPHSPTTSTPKSPVFRAPAAPVAQPVPSVKRVSYSTILSFIICLSILGAEHMNRQAA